MKWQRTQFADAAAKLKATDEHLERRGQICEKIIDRRVDELAAGTATSWLDDTAKVAVVPFGTFRAFR